MIQEFKSKGLGDLQFLITKGAIAEVEYYFKKPILNCIAYEWTAKHWYVTFYECYKLACLKNKSKVKYTLDDFLIDLDDDFADLVKLFDVELDKLLGLTELANKISEQADTKKK